MGLFDDVVGSLLNGDAGKYQAILNWVMEFRCCWRSYKTVAWVT